MSPSDSDKENAATSRDMTLNPIAIAESSSRIIQQSRQALAPKANFDPLSSSSSASRPQLFDAKGRPTHFPSRASYRYHNGTLSVKRQRTHAPSTQTQSSAPSTSELLALAENDDSDNDADGERDWEVCDHDFSAASPPLQFSVGRRVELTGVRKSIPLLASLSMVRNVSPSAPGPSAPEQPKSLEPERPPGPPLPAPEPAVFASEPQKSIGGLLPPFPLLPSTQESELTELGEFEGLLYDFPLVPQRQAAAAAEARFSVQVKREAIQRAIAPPKTPHGQKGRSGNGVIWTVGEEIDLVRFIFKDSVQFEWDRKSVSKQLPAGRSADEVQARWKTLLNYLNGHGELPNAETTTPWSLDEDDEILSAIIDCIPTYGRALAFGKEQGGRIRTANAFGSK
ncbi:hypothetical protein FRB90_004972 [Tulasnella sp. 427]|nr:hypothetical protein FRB90_004972 [Tulasnella sp. 427]